MRCCVKTRSSARRLTNLFVLVIRELFPRFSIKRVEANVYVFGSVVCGTLLRAHAQVVGSDLQNKPISILAECRNSRTALVFCGFNLLLSCVFFLCSFCLL